MAASPKHVHKIPIHDPEKAKRKAAKDYYGMMCDDFTECLDNLSAEEKDEFLADILREYCYGDCDNIVEIIEDWYLRISSRLAENE